jgi:hypothetical protein
VLLVGIPRRPEALRPDRYPDRARALRDRILSPDADAEDVPRARQPIPAHVRVQMAALPRAPHVGTTLDLPLQIALERLAAGRLAALPEHASLAIVVADARSREIRAIVYSARPFATIVRHHVRPFCVEWSLWWMPPPDWRWSIAMSNASIANSARNCLVVNQPTIFRLQPSSATAK